MLLKRTEQPFCEVYFENVGQPEIEHKREKIFVGYSKINTLRDRSLFKSKGVAVEEKIGGLLISYVEHGSLERSKGRLRGGGFIQ